jgi:hypothetical protein
MSNKKYKRKLLLFFVNYAVKKPIIYFLIVAIGLSVFIFLSLSTRVPVVDTQTVTLLRTGNEYNIVFNSDTTPLADSPIYIYTDRNAGVVKITEYDMNNNTITFTDDVNITPGTTVSVDIEIENISLLRQIFLKAGKSN